MLYRTVVPQLLPHGSWVEGPQGLVDVRGNEVLAPVNTHVGPFHDGLAAIGQDYVRYGFVDTEGRWAIEPRYHRVSTFADDRCLVCRDENGAEHWAFVDRTGTEVFPVPRPDSHEGVAFSEGRLVVREGGKFGYLDRSGALVIPHRFDQALPFREGLAPACEGERWGFIDLEGRWAIEPRWLRAFCFQEGVACVVSAGRNVDSPFLREFKKDTSVDEFRGSWGLVDRTGTYVHPPAFDYSETELGTSMAFADSGQLGPTRFSEGHAIVRQGGKKWGLLRRDGALVVPASFERIGMASEGLVLAKKKVKGKSLWGVLDLDGAWVLTPRWSSVLWPLARFSRGVCPVGEPVTAEQTAAFRAIGQYPTHATGFVDRTGAFVIAPRFAAAVPFVGELAWVVTATGWAYVDVRGEPVWETKLPR